MKYYYQIEGHIRNNIGDVLQGMVAKKLLPKENTFVVDREALADVDSNLPALFIANGWYMHTFEKFPTPDNVKPVYVSMHIANSKLLGDVKIREHFKKNSPIGCRDIKTKKLFLGWGIPAYYSGCLTITCNKRKDINNSGKGEILLVDNVDHPIPHNVKDKLESYFNSKLIRISHDPENVSGDLESYNERIQNQMNSLLERYCEARLVITTKIHCALPCLGMGGNVMLIHPNPDDPRLNSVNEFIDILSYDDILNGNIYIPKVKKKKIITRQNFLNDFVSDSVNRGENIVRSSNSFKYKWIRISARINAKTYRMLIYMMFFFGIKKEQIQRVYGFKKDA